MARIVHCHPYARRHRDDGVERLCLAVLHVGGPLALGSVLADADTYHLAGIERGTATSSSTTTGTTSPDAEDLTAEVFLAVFCPLRQNALCSEVRACLATVLARYWRRSDRRRGHRQLSVFGGASERVRRHRPAGACYWPASANAPQILGPQIEVAQLSDAFVFASGG